MKPTNLKEIKNLLESNDPVERMNASIMAARGEFKLTTPPPWFSFRHYPDILAYTDEGVILGTNSSDIRIESWLSLIQSSLRIIRKTAA